MLAQQSYQVFTFFFFLFFLVAFRGLDFFFFSVPYPFMACFGLHNVGGSGYQALYPLHTAAGLHRVSITLILKGDYPAVSHLGGRSQRFNLYLLTPAERVW